MLSDRLRTDGGVLLRVEFLDAAGFVKEVLGAYVVADLVLERHALAFLWCFASRPHAHSIRSVRRQGDRWSLRADDDALRIVVSPIRSDEHRRLLEVWRAQEHSSTAIRELRSFVDALLRDLPRRRAVAPAKRQRFRARWHSKLGADGRLHDIGVLVLGPGQQLTFRALPPHASLAWVFNRELSSAVERQPAEEIFDYFQGNSLTSDWSQPQVVWAASAEEAAARLLGPMREAAVLGRRTAIGAASHRRPGDGGQNG